MTKNEATSRMAAILKSGGIAFSDLDCFGSQVIVTCRCSDSARKVGTLLSMAGFTIRGITKSVDYVGDTRDSGNPKVYDVWRAHLKVAV